jgi:hypothetical protein
MDDRDTGIARSRNSNGNSSIVGMLTGALSGGQGHQENQGGSMSDILRDPLVRAVIGGITTIAMKKKMNHR